MSELPDFAISRLQCDESKHHGNKAAQVMKVLHKHLLLTNMENTDHVKAFLPMTLCMQEEMHWYLVIYRTYKDLGSLYQDVNRGYCQFINSFKRQMLLGLIHLSNQTIFL